MKTNFNQKNPKKILGYLMAMFVMVFFSMNVNAQCLNTSAYGSATANAAGTVTISTCNYLSEYSTISGIIAATSYTCEVMGPNAAPGYITITEGSSSGTVVAHGSSPLTWTANSSGTHYAHWHVDASCATASGCHTTTITGNAVAIAGCTDPLACNYDSTANVDDGSCTYPGCTDSLATNYNSIAGCDDGSCQYSCTSAPYSENFDAGLGTFTNNGWTLDANGTSSSFTGPSDDMTGGGNYVYYETSGSPQSPVTLTSECLDISALAAPALRFYYHMYGGAMGTLDVSVNGTSVWSLSGDQGNLWHPAQIDLSAFVGNDITIVFSGTYGGSYTGDMALDNIEVDELQVLVIPGCMDSLALNYNPNANVNDTSCLYPPTNDDCANATPIACGGGAIGNNTGASANSPSSGAAIWYSVVGQGGDITVSTCGTGFDTRLYVFDACGGNQVAYNDDANCIPGVYSSTSTTTFTSVAGTVYYIAVSGYSSSTSTGQINISASCAAAPVLGCTDSTATNYNPLATVDDGSCTYLLTPGCMDSLATNYNPLAQVDDGSCTYSCAYYGNVTVNLYLSSHPSYCDGWYGMSYTLTDANGVVQASGTPSGSWCNDTIELCLPAGCYTMTQTFTWAGYGWSIAGVSGSSTASSGSATTGGISIGNGCVPGCMDSTATNYNPLAQVDDGSCTYPAPMANLYFSEYAEGSSNHKYFEVYNASNDTVDLSSYAYPNVSNAPSTPGQYEYWNAFDAGAVVAPGDVYIVAHPSADPSILAEADETHYYLSNGDDGYALVYGDQNSYVVMDWLGDWDGDPGSGWSVAGVSNGTKDHTLVRKCSVTQGNTSWTASAGTNTTDSEWEVLPQNTWTYIGSHVTPCPAVPGCTDSTALNYNPLATVDDGSCVYCVYGCTDTNAVNYNALATCDDGSCIIGGTYGCTDSTALNYNPAATLDDGSCIYCTYGCMDTLALNYSSSATCDDGSCLYGVAGCTDPNALNYNASATYDDGSCTYPAANLYFSEYAEGSSNNKYFEVYNASNDTVDLSAYAYPSVSNAPSTPGQYEYWNAFDAGAVVAPGDVYIVAHPSADPSIVAEADEFHVYLSNGDDGYALVHGDQNSYAVIDWLGDWDGDPGSGWSVAGVSNGTKDHTLVRKCSVTQGNTSWTASAGTNTTDSEWEVLPQNTWTYIGSHVTPCPAVPGCTDSTALNYNPLATVDDGSCIPIIYGCTDSTALNYYPGANVDDGSCCYVGGCTDPLATNYDSTACVDDGSCVYVTGCSEPVPTGVYAYDIIDERAKIAWDNMNDSSCMVNSYRIRYREVGTTAWSSKTMQGSGLCIFGLNTTVKQMLNLTNSTTYEYYMKAWYCGGAAGGTAWSGLQTFTTQGICPDITNLTVTPNPNNNTRATFCWDTTGTYLYARVKYRVDTSGSAWVNVGGFGVYYPTTCKVKFGMVPGQNYRGTGRAFCDPNMSAYNSNWTPFIFWTQPSSIRVDGGTTINNLDVYPNPSRDIFNVSFTSEDVQDLEIRVLSVVGEVVYTEDLTQFVGEYTKAVDLEEFTKGIYFLEITTNSGVVNKKLILQ